VRPSLHSGVGASPPLCDERRIVVTSGCQRGTIGPHEKTTPHLALAGLLPGKSVSRGLSRAADHRATAPALPQLGYPCPRHGPHSVCNRCAVARAKEPRCKVAELERWFCCDGCLLSARSGHSISQRRDSHLHRSLPDQHLPARLFSQSDIEASMLTTRDN
jgi:hypothetical protein